MKIKYINVYSLGRSGTHAASNWICGHFDNSIQWNVKNYCSDKNEIKCLVFKKKGRRFVRKSSNIKINNLARIIKEKNIKAIISVVDTWINEPDGKDIRGRNIFLDNGVELEEQKNVIVVRSPWNHYASLIFWDKRSPMKKINTFAKMWTIYAKEYLNETNYINNKVQFNYDKWFQDKSYRESISKQLNLRFSDSGLNWVSCIGGGSTFDSNCYNDMAQKMEVLERWKGIDEKSVTHKELVLLLKDPDINKFISLIFGAVPCEFLLTKDQTIDKNLKALEKIHVHRLCEIIMELKKTILKQKKMIEVLRLETLKK